MSSVKRTGLRPLRSSTNLINSGKPSLAESRKSFGKSSLLNTPTTEKCDEPKVSITEQIELTTPSTDSKRTHHHHHHHHRSSTKKNTRLSVSSNQSTLTPVTTKETKKLNQSLEKKKVKKAIKTVLNKEQRIKRWLSSKETVDDYEYWRLTSERLAKELTNTLDHLDEVELENELLVAELEQVSKLAEQAYKMKALFDKIAASV